MAGRLSAPVAGRLSAPLCRSYKRPPAFILWLDASGDAMRNYFSGAVRGAGVWLRVEFRPTSEVACARRLMVD